MQEYLDSLMRKEGHGNRQSNSKFGNKFSGLKLTSDKKNIF
jgi:hypothetical protein